MTIYGPQLSAGMSTQGNTAGTTGLAHDQLLIVGGANITLSQSFNANSGTLSIIGGAGAAGNTGYLSAGTTYGSLGTILFSNANGVSFGVNGQTMTASVSPAAGDGVNVIAAGTQTANTTGTVLFNNSNGITFGMSNNSVVTASHNGITSQSNPAISGSNGSFTFQTATFGNSNGASFYTTNGSMVLSYTTPAQSVQTLGGYAVGNTTGQSSSSTFDARTLSFNGGGIVSVGYSAGSVLISATAAAGAAGSDTWGASNLGNLSGTTGVVSGSAIGMYMAGGNNITLSQSINGSNATITVIGPAAGAPPTQKMAGTKYQSVGAHGNAFLSIQPIYIDGYMTATHVQFFGSLSGNTNSSGAISMSFGLYTANGSTMSLASSQSGIIQWTSGTNSTATSATQFGIFNSARMRGLTLSSWGISPGNYMALMWLRTTNNGTMSVGWDFAQTALSLVQAQFTSEYANMNLPRVYTASATTAMPASIAFSNTDYNLSGSGNKHIALSIHHSVP